MNAGLAIRDVEALALAAPLAEPLRWATGELRERRATLVHVRTANGIEGWGEAGSHGGVAGLEAVIAKALAPLLIGADAGAPEERWRELYALARRHDRGGLLLAAIAGIDMALWDVAARAIGVSLRTLLGGRARRTVPAYATGFYLREGVDPLEAACEEAAAHRASGFCAMKMTIGGRAVREDLATVAAVRERMGPDVALMVDAHRAYELPQARRVLRGLAPLDVRWLEEPLDSGSPTAYRKLRRTAPMPLAAGESVTELGELAALVKPSPAVDVLQPSLAVAGGLTPLRGIAAAAKTTRVTVVPHCSGSAVALAATAQAVATLRSTGSAGVPPSLELDTTPNPLRSELAAPLGVHDGLCQLPHGPGLGVVPDASVVEAYLVRRAAAP